MASAIYRLIKYGLQTFWRQRLLTAATMVVMILALLVFQGLVIFGVIGKTAISEIENKIDISIYFKTNTPEDEALRVKRSLEEFDGVREVEYISRDRALELFRERHTDEKTISQALDELEDNPLSASLNIRANNPEDYETIASYLEGIISDDLVEEITFNENRGVIERLTSLIRVSRQIGVLTAIFLTVVAILVAFNTILLGIYSNRDEISIMRLVGASNLYVQGPFVVMGIIYGVLASIFSMILVTPAIYLSSPYVKLFIPNMNLVEYFTSNLFTLFLYQLLFGISIGIISSIIAIRRYLKV